MGQNKLAGGLTSLSLPQLHLHWVWWVVVLVWGAVKPPQN